MYMCTVSQGHDPPVYMDWAMRPGSRTETRLALFMMETGVRLGALRIYSSHGHYVTRISFSMIRLYTVIKVS